MIFLSLTLKVKNLGTSLSWLLILYICLGKPNTLKSEPSLGSDLTLGNKTKDVLLKHIVNLMNNEIERKKIGRPSPDRAKAKHLLQYIYFVLVYTFSSLTTQNVPNSHHNLIKH